MTSRPDPEERALYRDLEQRYLFVYGLGLQARLAAQGRDILGWSMMGKRAKPRITPERWAALPGRVWEIIRAVAQERGVGPADIMGYQRTGRIADARQECYRRLREMSWGAGHPSLLQIGLWLHRDHTTIHQGLKG